VFTDENLHTTYRIGALRGEREGIGYLLPWQRMDQTDAGTVHRSQR
jgi:hypothetical protein